MSSTPMRAVAPIGRVQPLPTSAARGETGTRVGIHFSGKPRSAVLQRRDLRCLAAKRASRRDAFGHMTGRHVGIDHGVGADHRVVADLDRADELGPGEDGDAVTDTRVAIRLPVASPSPTQCDLVMDDAIGADPRAAAHDDAVGIAARGRSPPPAARSSRNQGEAGDRPSAAAAAARAYGNAE